jgi:archaellum biogenesis ATPase FlaH
LADFDKQKLLISYLIADPPSFALCKSILDPEYFDKELQKSVKYIIEYTDKYKSLPNLAMIAAETGDNFTSIETTDINLPNRRRWICDEVEKHCRQEAVINAVLAASDKISTGDISNLVDPIKNAVLLSLQRELGTNYFLDPHIRLRRMLENSAVSTGFKHLDEALYGGVMRGGVNIFAASSGIGKSFMLANLCVNHALMGQNVLYITLELPEDWVSKRIYSMMTGIGSKAIFDRIDEVSATVMRKQKDCGQFYIKYLPSGSTMNEIRSYVKNLEIQASFIPDVIAIDYLDEMKPVEKVDMSNFSLVAKYCTEELRNFCMEEDHQFICYTASQMGKGALDIEDHNQDMLSGGKPKVNKADNVITLYQPFSMKEDGFIQLQLVKTRTSSGQGRKVMLKYNADTVRFTNADEEDAFPSSNAKTKLKTPQYKKQTTGPQPTGGSNLDRIAQIKNRVSGGS